MYSDEVPLNTPSPPLTLLFASDGAPNGPAGGSGIVIIRYQL